MTRIIAVADNYLELISGLRARVSELGINYATIDTIAGWGDTYATKLLGKEPIKGMGPMSFDAMLGALALKVALIDDPEKLQKIKKNRYFMLRRGPMPIRGRHEYVVLRKTREQMRQMSKEAAKARVEKIPPHKRSRIARKAALTRWRKPRLVEITKRKPSGA